MNRVKIGIIGVGGMGSNHARTLKSMDDVELSAVCDIDKEKADQRAKEFECAAFYTAQDCIAQGGLDAVVIATPHYDHTTIGIQSLSAGLHTLVEKPISVHKADAKRLIAAHTDPSVVFAAMFNQRTDPHYQKVKQLIDDGELGALQRVNWIITDWFRSQAYYDNGGWRATWKGEGGGVLLNQCPHQLDLLQWLCGMPTKIHAHCHIAKYHTIEVEDEVSAYLEYPNGATGIFIASTGETPGTNRLEITGTRGKVVIENGAVNFVRNCVPSDEFCKSTNQAFAKPETWHISIPVEGTGKQHAGILKNFIQTIQGEESLIAPAGEGINSVEIGNSMLYSSMTGQPVTLPLDSVTYEKHLISLIENSTFTKSTRDDVAVSMRDSF